MNCKKMQTLFLLLLFLLSLCGCKAETGDKTDNPASTLKEIAGKNAPDTVFSVFSGIALLDAYTCVAGENLLVCGKNVYRYDLQTAFSDGLNLQAVYTFPQAEASVGYRDFYMDEDGEISGGLWLADAKQYRIYPADDGKTYQSAVLPYDGHYLQNEAELCFQGNISFVSDSLFVSENKLYLVSAEPKDSYLEPDSFIAQPLDTSAIGEDEMLLCLYNNHFIRTDRSFYVLPGKTAPGEGGTRIMLDEYAPAVPVTLLSEHIDEILFIGGPNLFLRDGTVIPMTALFPQYSDCSFGTWPTRDYLWDAD